MPCPEIRLQESPATGVLDVIGRLKLLTQGSIPGACDPYSGYSWYTLNYPNLCFGRDPINSILGCIIGT